MSTGTRLTADSAPVSAHDAVLPSELKGPVGQNGEDTGLVQILTPYTKFVLDRSGAVAHMRTGNPHLLRPMTLRVETVNICNFDCVFCPYSSQTRTKGFMSMELFNKLLEDYHSMGGGLLKLIPVVGDILLDRYLMERMESLARYANTIAPAVCTNLYGLDRFTDEEVAQMLRTLRRLMVSWYGLTEEENKQITQRKSRTKVTQQMQRLLAIRQKEGLDVVVQVRFRFLHDYPPEKVDSFMQETFGCILPIHRTSTYMNWGNAVGGQLPGEGLWEPPRLNVTLCTILATWMTVYWDGRVTACGCCDFDASKELALGNLDEQSLLEIYNGPANQHLWKRHQDGDLPAICKKCTLHQNFYELQQVHIPVILADD